MIANAKESPQALILRKRWYTPAEVGRLVGVSRQTVVKWIRLGDLHAEVTDGGHYRIPASAFDGIDHVQRIPVRR